MPGRPGIFGIRGHQSLLDREDKVVRGVQRRRWQWRISPAEPDLHGADGFAQTRGRLALVVEAKHLDVFEQDVGFGEEKPATQLGGSGHACTISRGAPPCQVLIYKSGNPE